MTVYTAQQFDYYINKRESYNKYYGWCHYYEKDTCEVDLSECKIIKKMGYDD